MSECGCNPWNQGGLSTQSVCGDFTEPTNPDQGICSPHRVKTSCEAPTLPQNPCNDTAAYVEFNPSQTPPFTIIATIFDEDCNPIQDENGAPIMGPV